MGKIEDKEMAATILRQLGGNRFLTMTGCKNLMFSSVSESNPVFYLSMKIGSNAGKVNYLKVFYNEWPDDYAMEFCKYVVSSKTGAVKITNVKRYDGLYFDQLQSVFTEATGLYTSL